MIDEIAATLVRIISRFIWVFIIEVILEVFFFYTGEIILLLLTLGRRKPQWTNDRDESSSKLLVLADFSTWIGIAFWLFVAWYINDFLFP